MKRDEAIDRLRAHETELKRLGVERLYLFGSTAREEASEASDVDLFFDHEKGKLGLFGANTVRQNGASDAFVFQPTTGEDTINGFSSTDTMQFSASDFANWAALSSHLSQSGSNTVIQLDATDNVTLTNVTATSLSASQFHFV